MQVLALAFAWALIASIIELCVLAFDKFLLGRITEGSAAVIWMTPLSNILTFLIPAVILLGIGRLFPRLVSLFVVVSVLAFLGFLNVLFLFSTITMHMNPTSHRPPF